MCSEKMTTLGIHKTQDEEKKDNTENLKDDQHGPHQKQGISCP
jgi:hypothetical protein